MLYPDTYYLVFLFGGQLLVQRPSQITRIATNKLVSTILLPTTSTGATGTLPHNIALRFGFTNP